MAGTELLTGTQVPLDAAYLLDVLGNLKLGERGQTLGYNESLLNYYARREEAERQYEVDVQQLGLQAADLRFRERNADAVNELQRRSGVVDQESLNYTQRAGLADRKLGVSQMLSDRSGPRDWVKYDSLLDMLDAPTPERSTTLDPFKFLEGLVREVDVFNEKLPSVQSGYAPTFSQAGQGARQSLVPSWLLQQPGGIAEMGGGGSGGMVPQSTVQQPRPVGAEQWSPGGAQPAQNVNLGGDTAFSGVRNEDVANIQRGGGALMTTGTAGPTWGNRFEGWQVSNPSTGQVYGPDDEIGAGMPIWMQRLFRGGEAKNPPMALTGDGPGKRMNEDTELAMALLDEAGQPVLKVLNPEQTKKVVRSGKVKPKRAASGGTYGTGNTDPTMTFNQYGSGALGNQSFIRRLFGSGGPSFKGLGAELTNPQIGVTDAPALLNLQNYRDLDVTGKEATEELYNTGLEVDFRDLLERSRRAAPWGKTFAPAGYGY